MSLAEIKQLPKNVANQIAAGEVVERPLSVIKELLENALDANATALVIDIEKGGLGLCRVRDDGSGIPSEQLLLAVAPHATSKIKSVDDLMALHSLGFRGEALASISSVSRFTLTSKPGKQETASQLCISDNDDHVVRAAAHPNGTTIEVRDLFYNVPVRRTFLKSEKTEFTHIELVVKKIALSRFELSIQLTHNGKTHLKLPAAFTDSDVMRRISRVLGKAFMASSSYFESARDEFELKGWLGSPDYLRSQTDLQYLFLNGRMVRDKVLMHAVRKVYEPYLYPGRAACFLLYFNLPTQEVDVNVHPTKHEVRFKSPRSVHDFMVSVLSKQLAESSEETVEKTSQEDDLKPIVAEEILLATERSLELSSVVNVPSHRIMATIIDGQIIPLNKTHGLLVHDGQSFIFNVPQLYQQQLLSRLEQALRSDKTLVSRPVLVPLMVPLTAKELEYFPFERVQRYGFEALPMANNVLAVRAFPVMTPHLDIPNCMKAMAQRHEATVEKVIASHQMMCLSQLSESEKNGLMRFLIEQRQQGKQSRAYKCVTEQQWQAMLNEK